MLVDGFLVPDPPHFLHRELSSPTLNTFAVAVVTTLFTYQLTAVVYALLFIRKPHGYASVATLFSVLLARHASPISIASHVTRWDIFTRLHYRPHLDYDVRIERDRRQVPATVVLRLILLWAVAPLASVVAFVLADSHTRELTFREAGIDGFSFALREEYEPIEMHPRQGGYWAVAARLPPGDTMVADVLQRRRIEYNLSPRMPQSGAFVGVGIYNRTTISTFVAVNGIHAQFLNAAFISLKAGDLYALHVDLEDLEVYVDRGIEVVKELCEWDGEVDHQKPYFDVEMGLMIQMLKSIPCYYFTELSNGDDRAHVEKFRDTTISFVNRFGPKIVTAEGLTVEKTKHSSVDMGIDSDGVLVDGLDFVILERRRRNCGLAVFAVLLSFLSVLRTAVGILGRNDVGAGLECVVKQQLDLRCCEGFCEAREIIY